MAGAAEVRGRDLDGRRAVVVGLASSGRAAASLLIARGADVVGVDLRTETAPIEGVRIELGPHRRATFLEADLIVVSPGVPAAQADLAAARHAGIEVVGELGLASRYLRVPMLAVSGTNGKSTVTSFTGQLLAAAGWSPFVGGNLGRPLSLLALDPAHYDVAVVEVSSYQMELPGQFHPTVAAILNLTPDHLGRHGTMEEYGLTKARMFQQMGPGDLAFVPRSLEALAPDANRMLLDGLPGVRREGTSAVVLLGGIEVELDLSVVPVPGDHNLGNAAVAACLAIAHGADPGRVRAGLADLEALPHRMEVVAEADGILWINDSKATNVDAARVGISGIGRSSVVLLGGKAKGPGFAELAVHLRGHRAVIAFGGDGAMIADELEVAGVRCVRVAALDDAVRVAANLAQPGDAVLLSPGCASFDAFDNFEHRGRVFRELVLARVS